MKRIVQIGSYPLANNCVRGGVEASVMGLSNELSKEFEVHVFDIPRMEGRLETVKNGTVMVHRFPNDGRHQFSMAKQVGKIARQIVSLKPDICHIHGTSLYAWLMYRTLRKERLRVAVTVHGSICVEKRNALNRKFTLKLLMQLLYQGWVEKRFLGQLSSVIVDTEYVRTRINSYALKHKPMMQVIPQGIRDEIFSIRCSAESRIILTLGAIGERKGHLLTLKAFEEVRKAGIDAHLVIAGTVADFAYLDELRKGIDCSNFKDDVTLYTDLNDNDLMLLYQNSHLFVLHSEEESQGLVFAEAMAVGLPVVATDVGGVHFVVKQYETGLLSKYGDISGFADHIQKCLSDDELWNEMSSKGRKEAQDYRWNIIAGKIKTYYQSFC